METRRSHRWVEDVQGLSALAKTLAGRGALSLDSESNSGFAYRERLCLLQINDGETVWLLDLLSLPGGVGALDALRPMLEDPGYEVQLHGGEFDVGCLKRDYEISLAGVWDTQQAASFLGWPKTGYGAVVEQVCGITLPKAHTRHDWSQRPLSGPVLQYAVSDVEHLPRVVERLKQEVRAADLEEELQIACRAVEQATWNGGFRPEGLWGIKGSRQLPREAQQILMALYQWREEVAQALDLPAGRTLNNELLLALARTAPGRSDELRRLGVPRRVSERWSEELLEVVAAARRNPPELPPQPERQPLDRQVQKRGDRLKRWRREEAERREVPMQVVLPVVALKYLQLHGGDDLEAVPQLGTKRIRRYGEALTRVLASPT